MIVIVDKIFAFLDIVLGFLIRLVGGYTGKEYASVKEELAEEHKALYERTEYYEKTISELVGRINNETDKRERAERDYRISHEHEEALMASEANLKLQLERIPTAETAAQAAKAHSIQMGREIESLKEEITRLKIEIDKAKDDNAMYRYATSLQTQLHDVMARSETFGFPGSTPIPGSVSVSIDDLNIGNSEIEVARSRAIIPVHITDAIREADNMGDKLALALAFMKSSGALTRMVEKLVKSGAVALSLAYNPQISSYELYTEMACRVYAGDAILIVDIPDDIETPNTDDRIITAEEALKSAI